MHRLIFWSVVGVIGWLGSPARAQSEKASLMGLILDGATRQPVIGARVEARAATGPVAKAEATAPDGSFRLSLSAKDSYRVTVQANGYVNSVEQIDFSDPRVVSRVGKMIYLNKAIGPPAGIPAAEPVAANSVEKVSPPAPAKPPKAVTKATAPLTGLEPVFFAQSTITILPESQVSLDVLVQYLVQHPATIVELAGHTDNQGDFDQNVVLSRQRADVVRNYVVSKGANPNQLRTRGYGGTRPVATNNYEKTRPMNRRVEITIVKE